MKYPKWFLSRAICLLLCGLSLHCGTINSARPLASGEHQIAVTAGGPSMSLSGSPLLIPNLTLEGRSGITEVLNKPLDLNYGLHLTALAFGDAGIHTGASWLAHKQEGPLPAISVGLRQYLFSNHIDTRLKSGKGALWFPTQVDLTSSYTHWGHLFYGGVTQYTDWLFPNLLLTPFVGVQLDSQDQGWSFSTELRLYAINQKIQTTNVNWIGIGDHGSVGVLFGFAYHFTKGGAQ